MVHLRISSKSFDLLNLAEFFFSIGVSFSDLINLFVIGKCVECNSLETIVEYFYITVITAQYSYIL